MIREMILVSKDKFPLADGKTEKSVHSPKQHPYNNWPSSRFRDEKNPIAERMSTPSNRRQEKKTKRREMPLQKKQQRSYDKWVRFPVSIWETNFKRKAFIKEFAEFLRKVLPKDKTHQQQEHVIPKLDVVSEKNLSKHTSFPQRRFDVPSTSDKRMMQYTVQHLVRFFLVLIRDCLIHNTVYGKMAII